MGIDSIEVRLSEGYKSGRYLQALDVLLGVMVTAKENIRCNIQTTEA